MQVIFDENLSPKWPVIFSHLLGEFHTFAHINTKFCPGVKDEEWICKLQKEGQWIIITGDNRMKNKVAIKNLLFNSNMIVFFLKPSWTKHNLFSQTWRLLRLWLDVEKEIELNAGKATWYDVSDRGGKKKLSKVI